MQAGPFTTAALSNTASMLCQAFTVTRHLNKNTQQHNPYCGAAVVNKQVGISFWERPRCSLLLCCAKYREAEIGHEGKGGRGKDRGWLIFHQSIIEEAYLETQQYYFGENFNCSTLLLTWYFIQHNSCAPDAARCKKYNFHLNHLLSEWHSFGDWDKCNFSDSLLERKKNHLVCIATAVGGGLLGVAGEKERKGNFWTHGLGEEGEEKPLRKRQCCSSSIVLPGVVAGFGIAAGLCLKWQPCFPGAVLHVNKIRINLMLTWKESAKSHSLATKHLCILYLMKCSAFITLTWSGDVSGSREQLDGLYSRAVPVPVQWALRWLQLGADLNFSFFEAEPNQGMSVLLWLVVAYNPGW